MIINFAELYVMRKMADIIYDKCKNKGITHTEEYRNKDLIKAYCLKNYTRQLSNMREMAIEYPDEHPLDVVLARLESQGVVEILDKDPITGTDMKMIHVKPYLNYKIQGVIDDMKYDGLM